MMRDERSSAVVARVKLAHLARLIVVLVREVITQAARKRCNRVPSVETRIITSAVWLSAEGAVVPYR